MKRHGFLALAMCLLASGCDDSKIPLSDPSTSKPDSRLIGLWRSGADYQDVTYYHVGQAGEKFPAGVLRVVETRHSRGTVEPPEEYLAFPTVLHGKSYLNVVLDGDNKLVKQLDAKGWNKDLVDRYTFVKYQVDGDKLVLWLIDDNAKEQAIKSGRIKGVIQQDKPGVLTDTAENIARFVAESGDRLLNLKDVVRLERIEGGKKR